ncbi:MAG: DUF2061 domain-containing protein [Ignavibacteriales bacterium]|nr:DUF2061 domain-containing protein [Ignavibacteriales bacterium]
MESRSRSLAKAISWRFVGAVVTFAVSWAVTGSVTFAVSISVIETVGKTALFYVHERMWARIPLGVTVGENAGY